MIAYYPLEELDPPKPQQKSVGKPEKTQLGLEESELNYIVIAFIAGVIALAISDAIRA
jgi:hypothetical protein|tara:strand:- start:2650 stop:2823 length:174 start_codon:yes stop_codon:yes gene_type:complete